MFRQRTVTLIAFWLAVASFPAMAQNSNKNERIVNEVAGAYVECGVYFQVVADCIGPQDAATAASFHQLRNEAFAAAIMAGRSIGLLDETAKARADMFGREAMKAIANNCMNISILYQKHNDACTALVRDAEDYAHRYQVN